MRAEFGLPAAFPAEVLAEAQRAAQRPVGPGTGRADATDVALVTVDPPGSMDLDQAVRVARRGTGFRVHYAIADLSCVVAPGGPLGREVRARGQTVYLPDGSVPLHPAALSEGAASLLPDGPRPAVLWEIDLDADAEPTAVRVRRAVVRSRARLDYVGVQAALDAGDPPEPLAALAEFGRLRRAAAVQRGAVELELPEQEVEPAAAGGWTVAVRRRLAAEDFNAEVSLLTGTCAATLMLDGRTGLLRTLPAPDGEALAALRATAAALGIDWPAATGVAELLAGLPDTPSGAHPEALALRRAATGLLRGAGYEAFDGAAPQQPFHAGIGAPYAHVTAPLRRLADRFGTKVCLALAAGAPVPEWVRAALPTLPEIMSESDARAAGVARACIDRTEAALLADRVGATFEVIVLRGRPDGPDDPDDAEDPDAGPPAAEAAAVSPAG